MNVFVSFYNFEQVFGIYVKRSILIVFIICLLLKPTFLRHTQGIEPFNNILFIRYDGPQEEERFPSPSTSKYTVTKLLIFF